MKHWTACSLALLALFVAGCDTINHSQIQVLAPKAGAVASVPASERDAVKQAITEIATRMHMEDRTQISLTPGTICSFAQPDVKHPISIKAWAAQDRISVDIFQRPPEAGESLAYQHFRDEVLQQLKNRFGDRLKLAHKMNHVSGSTNVQP